MRNKIQLIKAELSSNCILLNNTLESKTIEFIDNSESIIIPSHNYNLELLTSDQLTDLYYFLQRKEGFEELLSDIKTKLKINKQ